MLKGICDICGKPDDLLPCSKCGRRVCREHFKNGLCSHCAAAQPRATPPGGGSQLVVPDSEKPTTVSPKDVKK